MVLKAFSSRHHLSIYDYKELFANEVDEQEIFSFMGGFDLEDERTSEEIATVSGIFFDEDKILNESENIVNIADMFDGDVYVAMAALSKSKLHNKKLNDEKARLSLFSCYIERIYIYPKFRELGLSRYIYENLEQIFLHCFNIQIHSFVIYPKPQQPDKDGNWNDSSDNDGLMLKKMISVLKKNGYKQLGKTGFYAINCAVDKN